MAVSLSQCGGTFAALLPTVITSSHARVTAAASDTADGCDTCHCRSKSWPLPCVVHKGRLWHFQRPPRPAAAICKQWHLLGKTRQHQGCFGVMQCAFSLLLVVHAHQRQQFSRVAHRQSCWAKQQLTVSTGHWALKHACCCCHMCHLLHPRQPCISLL